MTVDRRWGDAELELVGEPRLDVFGGDLGQAGGAEPWEHQSSRSRRYVWTVVGDSDIDAFSHVSAQTRTSI